MSRNPASALVRRAVLALAAFGAACSDRIPSAPARVPGSSDLVVTCQGDVAARTLSCGMSSAPPAVGSPSGFSADLIVGGQNTNVLLKSTNVRYDPATQIFQADVTVQNLLTPTLGTPDGNSVSGVRVFFHAGPSVVSGSGPSPSPTRTGPGRSRDESAVLRLQSDAAHRTGVHRQDVAVGRPTTVGRFTFDVLVDAATAPPRATTCLAQAGPTITLTGLHTTEYHNAGLANTKVDASTAQFMTGTNYPSASAVRTRAGMAANTSGNCLPRRPGPR